MSNSYQEDICQKYFDIIIRDGCEIKCKLYTIPSQKIKRVVLFGHGFCGHKENRAAEKFASYFLSKTEDAAVFTFDWPCHGVDVGTELRIEDCNTYLKYILEYINNDLLCSEIYGYATSFGGYLFLQYIYNADNPFQKIALRCPAVNMHDVLWDRIISPEDMKKIQSGGRIETGFDRKVMVDSIFLRELQNLDIQKYDYKAFTGSIKIWHGTEDEIVPFEKSKKFAEENQIEFVPVDEADHRFLDSDKMDQVIQEISCFFKQ